MHKKETDTIHVSQCVTMLKNSRFARLIAALNFLNSDFLAEAKKRVENYCTQQEKENTQKYSRNYIRSKARKI